MEQSVNDFISKGGQIRKMPTIHKPSDRDKVNKRYNIIPIQEKLIKPEPVQPLTTAICEACIEENQGQNNRRCLRCPHYKQFNLVFQIRDQIFLEHLPQEIYENVADMSKGKELVELLRQLPLDMAVPLLMQYVLNCTIQEVANYHKVTRQAVDKKNKRSLAILKTLKK